MFDVIIHKTSCNVSDSVEMDFVDCVFQSGVNSDMSTLEDRWTSTDGPPLLGSSALRGRWVGTPVPCGVVLGVTRQRTLSRRVLQAAELPEH